MNSAQRRKARRKKDRLQLQMSQILSNLATALESDQNISETITDLRETAKELRTKNV